MVRPCVHLFFVFSYKLYNTVQPVMKSRSCSKDSMGLRALRQRQLDTQPSSDSESKHPDLCKVKDSDSKGGDREEEKGDKAPCQSLFL